MKIFYSKFKLIFEYILLSLFKKIKLFYVFNEFCNNLINYTEIRRYFNEIIEKEKETSAGMATIRTLLTVLKKSKCKYHFF